MTRPVRARYVDVARGLACVFMFQAHGFDGLTRPSDRTGPAYAFTRLLATLPLPLFLVLAGAGVWLRFRRADTRGESLAAVGREVAGRGLFVMAAGYALNITMGWMDDAPLPTMLRADVLQVIGASLVITAVTLAAPYERRVPRAWAMALLLLLPSPPLNAWAQSLSPAASDPTRLWHAALAVWVDAPGLSSMPVFPLGAWCLAGAAVFEWAKIHPRRAVVAGLGLAIASGTGFAALGRALSTPLTRAHPAVYLNAVDLFMRALAVVAMARLAVARFADLGPDASPATQPVSLAFRWLGLLGRRSLLAYAFHLPLVYGTVSASYRRRLPIEQAAWVVVAVTALTTGVCALREWVAVRGRTAS